MNEQFAKMITRKVTKLIAEGPYVVAVEVEALFQPESPELPLYRPTTVRLFEQIAAAARNGDVASLHRAGRVFVEQSELASASVSNAGV